MNVSQTIDPSTSWPPGGTAPSSARPSRLTNAKPATKPEDSARFSLQHLVETATGRAHASSPALSTGALHPTAWPNNLRTVGTEPAAPWLDPAQRLAMPSAPAPEPTRRSSAWLYGVIGLLTGTLVMMVVGVAAISPRAIATESSAPTAPLAIAAIPPAATPADTYGPVIPFTQPLPEAPAVEEAPAPEPAPTTARTTRSSRWAKTSRKPSVPKDTTPKTVPPQPASPKPTTKTPAAAADIPLECILDPASCGRGKAKPSTPATSSAGTDPSLPAKLSSSQIKSGLADVKSKARTCGDMHAAPTGTKVTVRLSLEGKTGRVKSATPQAPYDNALGRCVANRLADATFPRFSNPAMGVVYSVRM